MFRNTALSSSQLENDEEGGSPDKNDASISMGAYRKRAMSSHGRSCHQIKRINEEREMEECHGYMQQCETRLRKASDVRREQQKIYKDAKDKLSGRTAERLGVVYAQR